ncbi:SLBB domain-containing protein [Brachyspira innocens]|uniref:SLBB domain-containing protein n=1 Tax=Brachyspira innocens TaxID=13264 RepID=A0ABT8Z0U5_9SPIR|nr:SLBB domain-containing protein [Brachyspira innocens]MDO6995142.1 SLBB domain-containing protein [Brachyspira innocens]MDO7021761.1 SLBB domain-containing protein [Brachyspira innocens]
MRDRILCLSFILLIFLFGIFIDIFCKNKNTDDKLISITVKGAVVNQGVYFCRYGVSVAEVLELCGGMTELGYLPFGFDYNTPITNDTAINIQKRYSTIRKNYEEN